jgi:integrase
MALEFRFYKGELVNHFFGRVRTGGQSKVFSLKTEIGGKPPLKMGKPTLHGAGDTAFEISRAKAEGELKAQFEQEKQKGRADHLTERLIESKTGRKVEYARLSELAQRWRAIPRDTKPSELYLKWCDGVLNRFAASVPCVYLHEVTPKQAGAHLEKLAKGETVTDENGQEVKTKGKTIKTVRDAEKLLRSAFARLLPVGTSNPFQGGIRRKGKDTEGGTMHRRPFTPEELKALFDTARRDPFLYPLVVTAACTGLRRGDVCRLAWKSVDFRGGFVSVKTNKTGKCVELPIFPPLREVLEKALAEKEGDAAFCFPEAVDMLKDNPDGLTWRFKKLCAVALFNGGTEARQSMGRVKLADVLPEALEAIQANFEGIQRDRLEDIARQYASGQSIRDIEAATGQARSGVSAKLHSIEKLLNRRFMPESPKGDGGIKETIENKTRADGAGRNRKASVLDWHGLRVTWVTLALSAGVPVEVVKAVTGHTTTETVLRHYFHPQRAKIKQLLGDLLPEVLTGKPEPLALPAPKGDRLTEIAAMMKELSKEQAQLQKLLNEKGGK